MTARLPVFPPSRLAAAALTLGLSSAAFAQQGPLRGFDAYTSAAIKAWEAPGLAVAQLQKQTGPDRRITAPSSILGSGSSPIVHDQWCGTWRTDGSTKPGDRDADFTGWLVTEDYDTPETGDALRDIPGESIVIRKASNSNDVRAPLLPGFIAAKRAALDAGALGSSISGSGPTAFAIAPNDAQAGRIGEAMINAYRAAGLQASARIATPDLKGLQVTTQ